MPSPTAAGSSSPPSPAPAVLLSVSCAQSSPVARLLSFRPFTFIGRISYGMYLWHFPLFTFINEQRTGLSPWPLFVVRVIPTIGVAMLSFFFVERPIRQGTFFTRFRAQVFTLPAVGVVVLAIVLATMPAADTIAVGAAATGTVPATAITAAVPATYGTTPTRVLLVGDSQALTLGIGLEAALTAHPKKYDDLHLLNEGILGCGVADGTTGEQSGGTFVVGAPCTPDPQSANCPPGGVFGPEAERALPGLDGGLGRLGQAAAAERGGAPGRRRRDPRPPLPRADDQHLEPDLRRLRGEPAAEGRADRHGARRAHGLR